MWPAHTQPHKYSLAHTCTRIYSLGMQTHTCTHTHTHTHNHKYSLAHTCTRIYLLGMQTHAHTHTHTHTTTNIVLHTHAHAYTHWVCKHTYTHVHKIHKLVFTFDVLHTRMHISMHACSHTPPVRCLYTQIHTNFGHFAQPFFEHLIPNAERNISKKNTQKSRVSMFIPHPSPPTLNLHLYPRNMSLRITPKPSIYYSQL